MAFSRIVWSVVVLVAAALLTGPEAVARLDHTAAVTRVTVLAGKPSEFRFKLSRMSVRHGKVVFTVKNVGTIPHTFKVCSSPKGGHANACAGKGTKTLSAGQSTSLVYTFRRSGRYEYICTIAGHAAAGMKGVLKVT
jgi:uncharacterized cupredoxin-like copper-binding protein